MPLPEHVRPKKSLGQNFLLDKNMLQKIIETCALTDQDAVLEIGPGTGLLTDLILPRVKSLVAVELDTSLCALLRQRYAGAEHFELRQGDFLKMALRDLHKGAPLRILGNIPYYITSSILFKVMEQRELVQDMTLLMQKEVALRIVARPNCKEYGILSVLSQAFAQVSLLLHVPSTVFKPAPKVDSALVRWQFLAGSIAPMSDEKLFRRLVRTAFGQRRKMLRKSLREAFAVDSLPEHLLTCRPESLSVLQWIELANLLAGK
jgi:16S rRNA (adenine1518-N6/adenine1519-N6)-dimethyltransferase